MRRNKSVLNMDNAMGQKTPANVPRVRRESSETDIVLAI